MFKSYSLNLEINLDLGPMTLTCKLDLDILKIYLYAKSYNPKCEIDLDLDSMTFIYELDLDIREMCLYAKNEVRRSRRSKVID